MRTRRKKKSRLVPVALLLALILTCGTVYAYMFGNTDAVSESFIPAQVSCAVEEKFNGDGLKNSIIVTNTSDIPAYLRVRLVTYFVPAEQADAKVVAAINSPALSIATTGGWIEGSGNTYYYNASVNPGDSVELLSAAIALADPIPDGYQQVIDVFAEAIQADPAKAAGDSWKVDINDAGVITGFKSN